MEVMESVVELELGEIDGDDMLGPRSKLPPVERVLPTQGWMRWWLGPNTRAEPPTPHSQIVFLIKKGGTSDYRVSSRDTNHTSLARHHEMSAAVDEINVRTVPTNTNTHHSRSCPFGLHS